MRRLVLLLAAALVLVAPTPAAAQSDAPRVYMMYFQVDFPDVPAWIENHRANEVPLFDALVEDGTIEAYDLLVHDTGGQYNVRYNIVAPNWDALGDWQDAWFGGMDEAAMGEWFSMIRNHTDQIWTISDRNIPEGASDSPVVYESSFHVDYAQIPAWGEDFAAHGKPALDRAVEEGLIAGWAELHHDTGGPWNVRYVYWLDSWDAVDDALARIGEIRMELGQEMETARMIRGHADDVWRSVPRAGN